MPHANQRLYFRGKRLRWIRYTFTELGQFGTRTMGMLDCGHSVVLSGRTFNKSGQRTTCPVCR